MYLFFIRSLRPDHERFYLVLQFYHNFKMEVKCQRNIKHITYKIRWFEHPVGSRLNLDSNCDPPFIFAKEMFIQLYRNNQIKYKVNDKIL